MLLNTFNNIMLIVSNTSILLSCKENLSLNQPNYFLQPISKLLGYVSHYSLLEFRAFQPRYPDKNTTFACIMRKARFLYLVPEVNLYCG